MVVERADVKLIEKAIAKRWPVSDAMKERLAERMADLVTHSPHARNRIAAGRVLVQMEKQNQADDLDAARAERGEGAGSGPGAGPVGVTVNVGVQIVESDDWYGQPRQPDRIPARVIDSPGVDPPPAGAPAPAADPA